MKKLALVCMGLIVLANGVAYVSAEDAKPEKGMVVGEVIEVSSFVTKGTHGPEHVDEGVYRINLGFPVGILEQETGQIWLCTYKNPAPASSLQNGAVVLEEYMGQKVVVQGLKYTRNGTNVIRIAIVSEY